MMREPDVIQGDEPVEPSGRPRPPAWASRPASPVVLTVGGPIDRIGPYARLLLEGEHRVLSAASDHAALDLLELEWVDLILLDENAGLVLVEEIRARGHDPIIVVLSDRPSMSAAREAMRLGAYAYVSRPCDAKLLRAMLDEVCVWRAGEECG